MLERCVLQPFSPYASLSLYLLPLCACVCVSLSLTNTRSCSRSTFSHSPSFPPAYSRSGSGRSALIIVRVDVIVVVVLLLLPPAAAAVAYGGLFVAAAAVFQPFNLLLARSCRKASRSTFKTSKPGHIGVSRREAAVDRDCGMTAPEHGANLWRRIAFAGWCRWGCPFRDGRLAFQLLLSSRIYHMRPFLPLHSIVTVLADDHRKLSQRTQQQQCGVYIATMRSK